MTFCESEFVRAFGFAKKALSLIGEFRTPPTPEIYSLWYRYAEGLDDNLCARMTYHIDEVKSLTKTQLMTIIDETKPRSDSTLAVCETLTKEARELQVITSAQLAASKELGNSVAHAATSLTSSAPVEVLHDCLSHIVASHAELNEKLTTSESQLVQTLSKVSMLTEQLSKMQQDLLTDALTRIGNRSYFESQMQSALSNQSDSLHTFLLLIDLDNFKQINDNYGHQSGDRLLQQVAASLEHIAGKQTVARIGGDEFAAVLQSRKGNFGQETASQIVGNIANLNLQTEEKIVAGRVSVSIGVSMLRQDDTRDTWFNRADKLLYHAKGAGRNCAKCERAVASSKPSPGLGSLPAMIAGLSTGKTL